MTASQTEPRSDWAAPAGDPVVDAIYDGLIALRPDVAVIDTICRRIDAATARLDYAIAAGGPATMGLSWAAGGGTVDPAAGGDTVSTAGEGWSLSCVRPPGSAPFSIEQRAEFEALGRHVGRAMRLRDGLLDSGAAAFGFSDLAERLGIGALLVRKDRRMQDASARAHAVLLESDGLFISGGRLCVAIPSEMDELKRLLRAVADGERPTATLAVTRPSGRNDLGLVISRATPLADVGEADLIVSIRDTDREMVRAPEVLRALYGFTAAEAELVADLVNGMSVEEAEAHRGISHNTTRAHLRSIYAKVGVGRLVDLVRAVASGSARLAPD